MVHNVGGTFGADARVLVQGWVAAIVIRTCRA